MSEIWRDIPGYEGCYQVSNLGQVKSLPRVTTRGERSGKLISQRIGGRVLKPSVNTRGYLSVVLRVDGKSITHEVHTLVALAFLGPRPGAGVQVRHLDGERLNCKAENLCYGSRSENQLDLYQYRGWHHRLSEADAQEIRTRLDAGEKGRDLAKEFGVCESNISAIKHRRTFAWLE